MELQSIAHQCPNCGGALMFSVESSGLQCGFCGSIFKEAELQELSLKAALSLGGDKVNSHSSSIKESSILDKPQDSTNLSEDYFNTAAESGIELDKFTGVSQYECPNCGAGVIASELDITAACHFCHTPLVLSGQVSGEYKPTLIIPFKMTEQDAETEFKRRTRGKKLLPNDFWENYKSSGITRLYVPYWLKSGTFHIDCTAEAKRSSSSRRGNTVTTTTKYYAVHRSLDGVYARVPCDGSRRIEDGLIEAIEPFDYTGLKKFTTGYLAGIRAEKFDVTSIDADKHITDRLLRAVLSEVKSDIDTMGYESVEFDSATKSGEKFRGDQGVLTYALLPVYFINYSYKGKDFAFVMNGQTGKGYAQLPMSKIKRFLYQALAFAICLAVGLAIGGLAYYGTF